MNFKSDCSNPSRTFCDGRVGFSSLTTESSNSNLAEDERNKQCEELEAEMDELGGIEKYQQVCILPGKPCITRLGQILMYSTHNYENMAKLFDSIFSNASFQLKGLTTRRIISQVPLIQMGDQTNETNRAISEGVLNQTSEPEHPPPSPSHHSIPTNPERRQ